MNKEPVEYDIACPDCGGSGFDRHDNNYGCTSCYGSGFVSKMLYDVEPMNTWKEAVLDACVLAHIPFYENDPMLTLDMLIQWQIDVALDPSVSLAAQKLILRGVEQAKAENPQPNYGVH
jgi:hypothetical protein